MHTGVVREQGAVTQDALGLRQAGVHVDLDGATEADQLLDRDDQVRVQPPDPPQGGAQVRLPASTGDARPEGMGEQGPGGDPSAPAAPGRAARGRAGRAAAA